MTSAVKTTFKTEGHFDRQRICCIIVFVVRPINLARIERHYAPADCREKLLDFKGLDGFRPEYGLERGAELGMSTVRCRSHRASARQYALAPLRMCRKRTVRKANGQIGIEHETPSRSSPRYHRVDVAMAAAPAHLPMTRRILEAEHGLARELTSASANFDC